MNALLKNAKLSNAVLRKNSLLVTAVRNHWNKDYKPAPYPLTEAERLAAAEKYNLHPSEYKPYADDGSGKGDYPDMPLISADSKDPFYPYDYPNLRRNFNEPLHADFDLVRQDRYDVTTRLHQPMWQFWFQFFAVMGGLYAVYAFFEQFKMFHAIAPRQYPKDGKKHYTFERE